MQQNLQIQKNDIRKLMDRINKRISDFNNNSENQHLNFIPLKIKFKLASPVMLSYPWVFFDGLISHIQSRRVLKELFDLLPPRIPLDFVETLFLPIKKNKILLKTNEIDYIYHASASEFENPDLIATSTLYKQFGGSNAESCLNSKIKKIDITRGKFKLYQLSIPINYSKSVTFYANADPKQMQLLCSNITHLGKKRAVGYGSIISYSIEKTDQDFSLIKNTKIMRTIPLEYCNEFKIKPNQENVAIMAYKPPYWDKAKFKLCTIPEC